MVKDKTEIAVLSLNTELLLLNTTKEEKLRLR